MTLRQANFRIDEEVLEALRRIKERDGIPVSEQLRRALLQWIKDKGEATETKADRRRASTRKRS